ncbi:hypothetical protein Bbelb_388740 [Branchiostoma belcheri]|nr:hypothetical protein Bbelb_388740 [Branchiostoma belcheri]
MCATRSSLCLADDHVPPSPKDLHWWSTFLPSYNGVSLLPQAGWSEPDAIFSSDACLSGCGGFLHETGEYFHAVFPDSLLDLELLSILVCARLWGKCWAGRRIVVMCDNEVSVTVLNSGRSRAPFLQSSPDAPVTAVSSNRTCFASPCPVPEAEGRLHPCVHLDIAYLPSLPAPSVEPWEIYKKLQGVKTRKAAGPDGIPGKLIKEFAYELSSPLADILNSSLQHGILPEEWKCATVVPTPKTKPPSVHELRPISLTSLLAKVPESFVTHWTLSDIRSQIDTQQYGCLKGRSTTHCLLELTNEIFKATNNSGVNRSGTMELSLTASPLHAAFLRKDLTDLENWSNDSHMRLHPAKSRYRTWLPLSVNGIELQHVQGMKILGVFLQANLRWNSHVDSICCKSSQRLFLLRKLKHFHISPEDLVTVYVSYIGPVLEYAAPVWHSGLTTELSNKIEKIQRRAVRIIMGAKYTSYTEGCSCLGLPTLQSRRLLLTVNFANSLRQSEQFRHFLPPVRSAISGRQTRSAYKLNTPRSRTDRYQNSALPFMIRLLNM